MNYLHNIFLIYTVLSSDLLYANQNIHTTQIGIQTILPTPLKKGTRFASPKGKGNGLTKDTPSSLKYAMTHLKGSDVLFLRGGTYLLSMEGLKKFRIYKEVKGTKTHPTIIESYPGEVAILDGSMLHRDINKERKEGGILIYGDYTTIRNIEVRNMPEEGIRVEADHVLVEGCLTHHNGLAGIMGTSSNDIIFRNNISHHNSDVSLGRKKWNYDNGNNADGITISYSSHSIIENNIVYLNSDDGIDIWGSSYCTIQNNKVYKNGYLDNDKHAGNGNGEGIKAGGEHTTNNTISHNLVWRNYNNGIVASEATNINLTYSYNTTWNNGNKEKKRGCGFTANHDTFLFKNISSDNRRHLWNNKGIMKENSWNRKRNSWNHMGIIPFMNITDINSSNFLRPKKNSGFEDIGAYATITH